MEREHYKGHDPYDALQAPVFHLPVLKSSQRLRFLMQQIVKRSPINLRTILRIKKGLNPVTVGLALQAEVHLLKAGIVTDQIISTRLLDKLLELRSPDHAHECWGYDFPWESRYATIPAQQPTVVATGIIANAIYLYWRETGNTKAAAAVLGACRFVEKELNRTDIPEGGFLFSYSPYDTECVLNASMKASRLLAQGHRIEPGVGYDALVRSSVEAVLKLQREDGSWPYSLRSEGSWTDNYHTGYILDCLDETIQCTDDKTAKPYLKKGIEFYLSNFIRNDGRPMLLAGKTGPADCTAGGQTILTLVRFGELEKARLVADWMIRNMQDDKGFFYYRMHTMYVQKTDFMRWSNAWMLAALSALTEAVALQEELS